MANRGDATKDQDALPGELIKLARRINGERVHVEIEDQTGRVRSIYARVRASRGQVTLESSGGATFPLSQGYAIRRFL